MTVFYFITHLERLSESAFLVGVHFTFICALSLSTNPIDGSIPSIESDFNYAKHLFF